MMNYTAVLRSTLPALSKGAIARNGCAIIGATQSSRFERSLLASQQNKNDQDCYFAAVFLNQKSFFSSSAVSDNSYNDKKKFSTLGFSHPDLSSHTPSPVVQEPGIVTKKLRKLDMNTVKAVLAELKAVDATSDERIDSKELMDLLRKHKGAFTDEEVDQLGELFYAGKSGGTVSFERFIEALDKVIQLQEQEQEGRTGATEDGDKDIRNPLDVGRCGDEFLFYHSHAKLNWDIKLTHTEPQSIRDRLAFYAVKGVRLLFDAATGWNGEVTTAKVLNRTIYLETVAAVPGMVAAIVRHFKSLRTFSRDGGMMQMFLDEANNERMHLLTFVRMKDPGTLFRLAVIGGQVGFGSAFLLSYIISPKFCHRFVGYVEEEACATYTKIIKAIEEAPADSEMGAWRTERAPKIARSYWHLGENGTVLDLMYAVRADEAEHRDVNHLCSSMVDGMRNPVSNTEEKLNTMLLKYVRDIMERTDKENNDEKKVSAAQ